MGHGYLPPAESQSHKQLGDLLNPEALEALHNNQPKWARKGRVLSKVPIIFLYSRLPFIGGVPGFPEAYEFVVPAVCTLWDLARCGRDCDGISFEPHTRVRMLSSSRLECQVFVLFLETGSDVIQASLDITV